MTELKHCYTNPRYSLIKDKTCLRLPHIFLSLLQNWFYLEVKYHIWTWNFPSCSFKVWPLLEQHQQGHQFLRWFGQRRNAAKWDFLRSISVEGWDRFTQEEYLCTKLLLESPETSVPYAAFIHPSIHPCPALSLFLNWCFSFGRSKSVE